jgi:hypothetical protein
MQRTIEGVLTLKKDNWTGLVVCLVPLLILVMDGIMKLSSPMIVIEASVKLGYPESKIIGTVVAPVVFDFLYSVPQAPVLCAIFMVGCLVTQRLRVE